MDFHGLNPCRSVKSVSPHAFALFDPLGGETGGKKENLLKPVYWTLQFLHHDNYLYKGIIKDLDRNGITFSPMFAEKVPYEIDDVDQIDDLIKNNAQLIKRTIDDLKSHHSI